MSISNVDEYTTAVAAAIAAADAYYNTDVELEDDAVYDQRLLDISAFETANPSEVIDHQLFTAVAAGTAAGTGTVTHTRPMLSLEKANTYDEVEAFLNRVGNDIDIVTEPKLDGLAINLVYIDGKLVSAATRADGLVGEDMTANIAVLRITGLPTTISEGGYVEVRGELVMTTEDFLISNAARVASGKPPFKNPRNAAVGTLRRKTIGYDAQVTFVAYDGVVDAQEGIIGSHSEAMMWLANMGFTSAYSLIKQSHDSRYSVIERIKDFGYIRDGLNGDFGYPTDGIVLIAEEYTERRRLGFNGRAPKYAMAFKYTPKKGMTTVRDIEVAVGRTGAISYTAIYDPQIVDGSLLSRATLHNPKFIADYDIRIGSVVEVFKAGDIIPRIELVLDQPDGSAPYEASIYCPVSGTELDRSGEIWRSLDPSASIGALINYAATRDVLDIDGLGESIADALVDGDEPLVTDLGDLFTLTVEDLAGLRLADTAKGTPRTVGQLTATKVVTNIEKAKEQPVARFITALGIRKSGRTFGRRLAARFHTFDNLLATTQAEFEASGVEGIGPERARFFYEGFQRNRPVIEKLRAAGANMGEEPDETSTDASAKPLAGMTIVVTGKMVGVLAGSRGEVQEKLEALGARASGSVSKTTSLLIAAEETGSKFDKATELGVTVLSEAEFADKYKL